MAFFVRTFNYIVGSNVIFSPQETLSFMLAGNKTEKGEICRQNSPLNG